MIPERLSVLKEVWQKSELIQITIGLPILSTMYREHTQLDSVTVSEHDLYVINTAVFCCVLLWKIMYVHSNRYR